MDKIYLHLPYILKYLIINFYGLLLRRKRYSNKFFDILREYERIDKTEKNILNVQKVISLTEGSRYYCVKDEYDFYNSPIITKEDVKNNYDKIINRKEIDSYLNTGGTTGSGLHYPISKDFIYHQWAVYWKFRKIHGLDIHTWCAYIMAKTLLNPNKRKPPFWIKDHFTRRLFLSLPHLNDKTIELYLREIKRSNIRWIHGYPSVLASLANLIQDNNLFHLAKSLNLKIITTSSEMLLDYQKNNIEEVFNCKVRQLYGLTEGVANIFECEYSSLHVDESFSYVEFVKESEYSNAYKIIGTQYHNKAFPLVRYDTGDSVLIDSDHLICKCGRKSRIVKEILGREVEYLLLENGQKIVRVGLIFAKAFNIKKAQIVQQKKGEADFLIVKGGKYTQRDEINLIKEITDLLGKDFKYNIKYTDNLIRTKNGKTRLIINETEIDKGMIKSTYNYVN